MNILLISTLYPEPEDYGTIRDTYAIHYFAREWVKQGHKVVVVHPYRSPASKFKCYWSLRKSSISHYNIDGVDVIFGLLQLFMPHNFVPSKLPQRRLAEKMHTYLNACFPEFRPDFVSIHFPLTTYEFVKEFCGNNTSIVLHNSDINLFKSYPEEKKNEIRDYIRDHNIKIGYRSGSIRNDAAILQISKLEGKIILSGIDDSMIANEADIKQRSFNLKNRKINIIYAGKLVEQKQVTPIIKALALIREEMDFELRAKQLRES